MRLGYVWYLADIHYRTVRPASDGKRTSSPFLLFRLVYSRPMPEPETLTALNSTPYTVFYGAFDEARGIFRYQGTIVGIGHHLVE